MSQEGQQVQEWLELGNGCICCSIKDFGVNAIESLMARRGTFDYIMLETSGLADPGSLAPLFWVDDGLGSSIYLDGIVTLVDAKNILLSLDEDPSANENATFDAKDSGQHATTAHMQISHADVIIINKCESVGSRHLAQVEDRIHSINSLAKVHRTSYSQVPDLDSYLLDLHAYDNVRDLDISQKEHSHLDPVWLTSPCEGIPCQADQLSIDHLHDQTQLSSFDLILAKRSGDMAPGNSMGIPPSSYEYRTLVYGARLLNTQDQGTSTDH